jgi:hypothetical protein
MKIDKKTFNWLIDSWAFSGELDAPDKAHALLTRMEVLDSSSTHGSIRPDVRSYTKVINAISRSGRADAGDMADKILQANGSPVSIREECICQNRTHSPTLL